MSHPRSRPAQMCIEMLKVLRSTWFKKDDLTVALGWSKNSVHVYLLDLVEQGLVEARIRDVPDGHQGPPPVEYRVAAAWRHE